jgi:Spy/CpxP family protein refolding chaperone
MKRKIFQGLALLAVPLFAGLTSCGHPYFGHHGRHGRMDDKTVYKISDKIASKLDMTDEQKGKMKILADKIVKKLPEFQAHRAEMGDTVLKQFQSDTFDTKEVNALAKKHEESMKGFHEFAVKSLEEFHSILTPDQRKKVAERITEHRKRFNK